MSLPKTPWLYRVAACVARPLLRLVTRPTWSGQRNVPRSGGIIVAVNHISFFDAFTSAHFFYVGCRRPPRILAKEPLFRVPVLGWLLRGTGMIPVHRGGSRAMDALVSAAAALDAGECVAIYPEGTITKDPDLWPMVGRTGAVRLALRTGAPLIPVAQWGAQDIIPRGARLPRLIPRKKVAVIAGEPIDLSDLPSENPTAEQLRTGTDRLMDAIAGLLQDLRAGEPPAHRFDPRTDGEGATH